MMTFSTFLAGCEVGGGTTRRMPEVTLMSGFEKPPRRRRLCPRRRTVDRAAVRTNWDFVFVWTRQKGVGESDNIQPLVF